MEFLSNSNIPIWRLSRLQNRATSPLATILSSPKRDHTQSRAWLLIDMAYIILLKKCWGPGRLRATGIAEIAYSLLWASICAIQARVYFQTDSSLPVQCSCEFSVFGDITSTLREEVTEIDRERGNNPPQPGTLWSATECMRNLLHLELTFQQRTVP